jgi:polyhydroxyalkanoate synthesis regulator protein
MALAPALVASTSHAGATTDGSVGATNNDLWMQFLSFQAPAMQKMMGAYVEQSQKMFQQMQDTMQEQTRKIFPGIYPKPDEKTDKKS